jgi:hypothetical protein
LLFSVAATVRLAGLLAQPKNPSGPIDLQQPEIAVAVLSLAGRFALWVDGKPWRLILKVSDTHLLRSIVWARNAEA